MPLDAKNLVKFSMLKFYLNFTRGIENLGVILVVYMYFVSYNVNNCLDVQ